MEWNMSWKALFTDWYQFRFWGLGAQLSTKDSGLAVEALELLGFRLRT